MLYRELRRDGIPNVDAMANNILIIKYKKPEIANWLSLLPYCKASIR